MTVHKLNDSMSHICTTGDWWLHGAVCHYELGQVKCVASSTPPRCKSERDGARADLVALPVAGSCAALQCSGVLW